MSQSSNGSDCPYEQQRLLDSAQVKKNHNELKKAMGYLVGPKPPKTRKAKDNATKTISEITTRVTRSSQNRNIPSASKLHTYQPKRM